MRRLHRKSRTGCAQCKRRRIKCDEHTPSCHYCVKNHLKCSLEFLTPKGINPFSSVSPPDTALIPLQLKPSSDFSALPFDTQTHELMHHYQTSVFLTLAGDRRQGIYRHSIPQLGLAHPFLLSGIRAISALHLATLIPARRKQLQRLAIAQESAALLAFRTSLKDPDEQGERVDANFAFAGSAIYYIMSVPDDLDGNFEMKVDRCRIPSRGDEYPHWFQMMRGMMTLLSTSLQKLFQGPFAPILDYHADPPYSINPNDAKLAALEQMCLSPSKPPISNSNHTSQKSSMTVSKPSPSAQLCLTSLHHLRITFAIAHSSYIHALCDKTALHMWPGKISNEFFDLILDRDPRALVLLAHYCVLLKNNDHVWCFRGIGTGLLHNIWKELDEDWRELIKWPVEQRVSCR